MGTRELAGGTERDEERREPADAAERDDQRTAPELLPGDESAGYRSRWETIQTGFVDEPRRTVEQADELVAE